MTTLLLVAAIVVTYLFLLPIALRWQANRLCKSLGFEKPQFTIVRATLWGTELRDFSCGTDLRFARLSVLYDPATLWRRRIGSVSLEGLHINSLAIQRIINATTSSTTASTEPTGVGAEIPLETIDVQNAVIELGNGSRLARVPLDLSARQSADGAFDIRVISSEPGRVLSGAGRIDPITLKGAMKITGRLDTTAALELAAALSPGLRQQGGGSVDVSGELALSGGTGSVDVRMAASNIWLGRDLASTNLEGLAGVLQVTGEFAPSGASNVVLTAQEINFKAPGGNLACEGLAATITIADPLQPSLQAAQRITVRKLTSGETSLTDGVIDFAIDGWSSLVVHQTTWRWLEGTVAARGLRFDRPTRPMSVMLEITDVSLNKLLDLLAAKRATGEGRISGSLPLTINWPRFQFGEGVVGSVGGGTLRIIDSDTLGAVATQAATGGSGGADATQRVVEALRDFEYNSVVATVIQTRDGLRATVSIDGKGRTGFQQPLRLDLNINGLDKLLNTYLGMQQKFGSDN